MMKCRSQDVPRYENKQVSAFLRNGSAFDQHQQKWRWPGMGKQQRFPNQKYCVNNLTDK